MQLLLLSTTTKNTSTVMASSVGFNDIVVDPTTGYHVLRDDTSHNIFNMDGQFWETVPNDVIEEFKQGEGLKSDYDVVLQVVSNDNTLVFPDGTIASLDDMIPEPMYTEDAKCSLDGVETPCPKEADSPVYVKYDDENFVRIQMNMDGDGNVLSVATRTLVLDDPDDENSSATQVLQTLEAVDGSLGVFTSLPEEAFDDEAYSHFVLRSTEVPSDMNMEEESDVSVNDSDAQINGMRRQLRANIDHAIQRQQQAEEREEGVSKSAPATFVTSSSSPPSNKSQSPKRQVRRRLASCSKYRVVEVAVAADSTFCASSGIKGNYNKALATIQTIMANVSAEYEMDGLCYKVKLSHTEVFCASGSDPYRNGVRLNKSGCGAYGLLDFFRDYWNANRKNVKRDLAQLMSGTGLECDSRGCVIGCAHVAVSCSNLAYSYGVNWVTYTTNTVARSNLVAHEMGHVLGANHDSSSLANIMYPSNSNSDRRFSNQSINSFLNKRNDKCITSEINNTPSPTIGPTSQPTSQPSRSQEPSSAPTRGPTSSPSTSPSLPPTDRPTIGPTTSPSASPTPPRTPEPSLSAGPSSSPSMQPTGTPTGAPTTSPSLSPTVSQSPSVSLMPTTSSPSSTPTDGYVCQDDPTWFILFKGKKRNCNFIAQRPKNIVKLCKNYNAYDGCPETCSVCTPRPTDSPTKTPTMAPTGSPTNGPTLSAQPSVSFVPTSGPSTSPSLTPSIFNDDSNNECQDDPDWYKKGKPGKTCDAVAARPAKLCTRWVGQDGTKAIDACPLACDNCSGSTTTNDDKNDTNDEKKKREEKKKKGKI